MRFYIAMAVSIVSVSLGSGTAEAGNAFRRMPAAACQYDLYSGNANDYMFQNANLTTAPSNGILENNSSGPGSHPRQLFCPIVSDGSTFVASTSFAVQRQLISRIVIDGYDGSTDGTTGGYLAHTCIIDNAGVGVPECSQDQVLSSPSTHGNFSVALGTVQLTPVQDTSGTHGDWYGTIILTMPAQGFYGDSSLFGLFLAM